MKTREEFRRSVVERMANAHEMTTENVEEWWEETAGLIRSITLKYLFLVITKITVMFQIVIYANLEIYAKK